MSNRPTILYDDFLILKRVCEQCFNQLENRIKTLEKTVKEMESKLNPEPVEVQ